MMADPYGGVSASDAIQKLDAAMTADCNLVLVHTDVYQEVADFQEIARNCFKLSRVRW